MDNETFTRYMHDQMQIIEKYCICQAVNNPGLHRNDLVLDWIAKYAGFFREQWLCSRTSV